MASSEVSICNLALTRLKAKRISDITSKGPEAELCNQYYAITRDELIANYDWHFTIGRIVLASISEPTLSEFVYKYQLPINPACIKVLNLIDVYSGTYTKLIAKWIIEGDQLHCNESPCAIRYKKQITNTDKFPVLFKKALALRLAMEMCMKLTQDAGLYQIVTQEYVAAYQTAITHEGSWSRNPDEPEKEWV